MRITGSHIQIRVRNSAWMFPLPLKKYHKMKRQRNGNIYKENRFVMYLKLARWPHKNSPRLAGLECKQLLQIRSLGLCLFKSRDTRHLRPPERNRNRTNKDPLSQTKRREEPHCKPAKRTNKRKHKQKNRYKTGTHNTPALTPASAAVPSPHPFG